MSTIKVQNIQHTGSSTNAIALASDGTCTANISANHGSQLGNRRVNVNGDMQVWQRSTSASGIVLVMDILRVIDTGHQTMVLPDIPCLKAQIPLMNLVIA